MTKVKLPTFVCLRCGHRWHPKKEEMPVNCAWCKSPRWNKEPKEPSKTFESHRRDCGLCKQPVTS